MDAVITVTIQVLLQNVLASIQEIDKASSYEKDLTQLDRSLVMVQKYLSNTEENQLGGHAVQEWLKQLEAVTFEADAVLDEVSYEILRHQVRKQNGGWKKVMNFFSSGPSKWIFRVKMVGKITDVISKLDKINKDATGLGLQTAIVFANYINTVRSVTCSERETDSFYVEPYVVGREDSVSEIVEKLITAPLEETISVIPIVGMGGVGKTTVARKVFNDERIRNHFGEKIWLSVSFNFDAVSLFKMILGALIEEQVKVTKEVALKKIQTLLADKKFLLVLDDVWNEKYDKWNEFMIPLSRISNVKGNCIIVTTRNENVASQVKTLPTHQLRGLTENQCWSIIRAETFTRMDVPEEFERIGKSIPKRCDGLPLAAKVVGGLLRGKSEDDWCSVLKNKLSDGDDDKIKKILRLSYDNLPSLPLKNCFAYCSVFPQDFSIERQQLIELWMAEGFLQVGDGNDMETVGSNFVNHLLQYSLFQDVNRNIFGDIVSCKMHDLVHDLAWSITKDMQQVRYLALESIATEPRVTSHGQMKYLCTLFFEGKIANDLFSNVKRLHVLKLTGKEIKELPYVIEKLIHLRSLDISLTRVEWLTNSIGKLYHLQTLSTAENLKKLPDSVINLVSLRHLHISADTQLPRGVGMLTSIQTLEHYRVRDENGCRIGELGNLKNLKGELEIVNLEMVKDKEEAEFANLYGKPGIFKLILKWNESRDDTRQHKNVLEGLQPHPRLKSLEIIGYKGKNLPSWTMRMAACNNIEGRWEAFNSLVEIKLKGSQCEKLPMLGHLPHLRFLVLEYLPNVRFISISFCEFENHSTLSRKLTTNTFPALERLELSHMPELTEWLDMEGAVTVFSCLQYLRIEQCPKLTHPAPHSLGGRASLKELYMMYGENLMELPDDLSTFCNLEKLIITDCSGLKSIPYDVRRNSQGLTSLRHLIIGNCKGLTDLPVGLLESCTASLEILCLYKLENLENLDILIPCLGRMSRLWHLAVMRIPKLMIFPREICCQRSLQWLEIGGFLESINVASFNDQLTSIFKECRSLKNLCLRGEKHWYSLPDAIQNLTSLQELQITNFGVEDMPEWIGNLSSLRRLDIHECQRLRHLPSKEAMKRLTKLYHLEITDCPLLKDRCIPHSTRVGDAQHDSEWRKISHIKGVWIDYDKPPTN